MWNETHIHFKTEGCTHCEEALNACSWVMLLGGHGGDGDAEERGERGQPNYVGWSISSQLEVSFSRRASLTQHSLSFLGVHPKNLNSLIIRLKRTS